MYASSFDISVSILSILCVFVYVVNPVRFLIYLLAPSVELGL